MQRHWGYSKHRRIKELIDNSYTLPKKLATKNKGMVRRTWSATVLASQKIGVLFTPRQSFAPAILGEG
jgi:hypothetical protein